MSITEQQHAVMVANLAKPGARILDALDDHKAHLSHMALGVGGEAGELQDAIKKHVVYDQEPDLRNIAEELGDLEFYMQGIRAAYGITREQTLIANMNKLGQRYAAGIYSDMAARQRIDKEQL